MLCFLRSHLFVQLILGTRHCQHFFRPWSGIRILHEKTKLTSWPSSSINAWKHPLDLHPSFGKKNAEIHVTRDRFLGSPCAISSRCRPLARRSMKARFQVWRFQKRGISSTTWQFCKKNMFSWFSCFFAYFHALFIFDLLCFIRWFWVIWLCLHVFFFQMDVEACSNPKSASVLSVLNSGTSLAILSPLPWKSKSTIWKYVFCHFVVTLSKISEVSLWGFVFFGGAANFK